MNFISNFVFITFSDTVNNIAFTPDSSHIISCSSDGSIAAVRCGNWKLEKHWKNAHKGSPVNCLAIHPSGKLALSLGGDGVLRTWNLVKGRQAYATNLVPKLGQEAKIITIIKWSPDGTKYLIATNFLLVLYSAEKAGIIRKVEFKSRVTCVEFIDNEILIVGHDDGQVEFYDLQSSAQVFSEAAHETRVKAVVHSDDIIATASSSGELKLWSFTDTMNLMATENCGARITCLVLAESFQEEEVKKEDIVLAENDKPIKHKKVFRIRQEVTIEDEGEIDGEEARIQSKKKSLKKLKRKSKSKTVSPQSIDDVSNRLTRSAGKKSKIVEEEILPAKRKKKRKLKQ